ncbi:MAG: chorismate synthase, partial [Alphaproteobacteria bacterium]|nr:chorismate synthase [Alphaproteobacteria bacterium]
MSHNSFGHIFRVTTFGESHGPALGCVVDGCPPNIPLTEADIQKDLDRRRPGQSSLVSQRKEPDSVRILSGVFQDERMKEQVTTGTPIALLIENVDARSRDYLEIRDKFRPGHADYTYFAKYGVRDYRGGGRQSARETAARVAAGAIARKLLALLYPGSIVRGALVQIGARKIDRRNFDWKEVGRNAFFCPDAGAVAPWTEYLEALRKKGSSIGAVIELSAEGIPAGLGAPIYGKLDADIASALMSINAVKGVEIGAGMAAAELTGEENADEMRAGNDGKPRSLS